MRGLAGRRFIESAQYREAQEGGTFKTRNSPFPPELAGIDVLDTRELLQAMRLRTFSHLADFEIDGVPYVGEAPKAANLPQAVETIPTEGMQVELAAENAESSFAQGVEDGTPYPEIALSFNGSEGGTPTAPKLQKLPRVGISAPVTLNQLDEPGVVESIINRRISASIPLGLENEMLNGGLTMGTAGTILAQAAAAGSPVVKSGYRAFAIRNAVSNVQEEGWYERPLQVVLNPATAAALFEEEDGSQRPLAILEMFDSQVDAWIVSKAMPAGEALVGDFFNAIGLFIKGPLSVGASRNHMDYLVRGEVIITIGCRAFSWVRQPSALCLVTGIS